MAIPGESDIEGTQKDEKPHDKIAASQFVSQKIPDGCQYIPGAFRTEEEEGA